MYLHFAFPVMLFLNFCGQIDPSNAKSNEIENSVGILRTLLKSTSPPVTILPPLERSLVDYIASSLEPSECKKVFALMTMQTSAKEMKAVMNLSSMKEYAEYLNFQESQEDFPVERFNCSRALKDWNEKVVAALPEITHAKDKQDFAETVLRVALSEVDRSDLDKLLHIRTQQIKHEDLNALRDEIESHTAWVRPINGSYQHQRLQRSSSFNESEIETPLTENDDGLGNFLSFLLVFFFVASFIFGFVATMVVCFSRPNPRRESPQSQYRPIDPFEGGGGGSGGLAAFSGIHPLRTSFTPADKSESWPLLTQTV